jgi:hypothetical protein
MPAQSDAQRKAAVMAMRAKQGQISPRRLTGSAAQMFKTMSLEELRKFSYSK